MDIRFRALLILAVGLLAFAAWTVPEWWTRLNPQSPAAEGLPGLEMDARVQFAALPNDIKDAYYTLYEGDEDADIDARPQWAVALARANLLTQDAESPQNNAPFEPPADAQVVAEGTFSGVDRIRQARGDLTIYQDSTGSRLLRLEGDFFSSRAPDVHVVFTRNPDPTDSNGVGVDFIDVGTLNGNYGAQTLQVPASVDFSRYPVVALYSVEYDGVLGMAALR
jgi:hypothetical protein